MEEILGRRPLALAEASTGVDIGFTPPEDDDTETDVEQTQLPSPPAEGETSGCSTLEYSRQHPCGMESTADEDSPAQSSGASPSPVLGLSRHRRPRSRAQRHHETLERMLLTQRQWLEKQRELSYAREERILSEVMAETARSTGFLISQIMSALRQFPAQATPQPQHFQPQSFQQQPQEMYSMFGHPGHHTPTQAPRTSTPASYN